jgi:tetratricopeptide (TPR) repeat protein
MRLVTSAVIAVVLSAFNAAAADVDRGAQLYREGKYGEAATELRRAVEQDESNARAHRYLGLALVEQEKLEDAARHLAKADEIAPSGETKTALARLYIEQKDYDKAEATLKDASGEDVEYVRGLLHFHRKDFEAAVTQFENHLKTRPENAYAHYYAGMAYSGIQRPDKMLTHFELFLKARPDAPEARKVRAVLRTVR